MSIHVTRFTKALILSLSILLLLPMCEIFAQQKRQTAKPPSQPQTTTANPIAAPTFDTLLGSDSYKIYVEARGVGQLIRSDSVNELLEPVLKLAAPPKELKTLIKWINSHADEVMTSRMLVAAWPTAKNVPDVFIAIEFESPEAAAKFEPQLNTFLPKVLPSPEASPSPNDAKESSPSPKTIANETPKPTFYLKQVGSLLLISPTQLTLKNLRPTGSKLLSEDVNFRIARNRFTSEQLFLYVDVGGIEREDQERQKQYEEEHRKREADTLKQTSENPTAETPTREEKAQAETEDLLVTTSNVIPVPVPGQSTQQPEPDPIGSLVGALANTFFAGQAKWPDAIAAGLQLESESLDVRALMLSAPGEKADVIPFFPNLVAGAPIVPESTSVLPADTELFAAFSLDLPQIYAALSKPSHDEDKFAIRTVKETESSGPFTDIEKKLKIRIKEDLLPLLGSEVVVSMPVKMLEGGPRPTPSPEAVSSDTKNTEQKPGGPSLVIALSLKDKEGMRALLPKLVESLGFKGASGFAHTERREDTELVSYGNAFAYAFIGSFLVVSLDTATTRHVVDSYLKHETLSGDAQFKNYTRWQPRQLQAQVYVSPALMESYITWANEPTTLISDQTREFLTRISVMSQPVTYSLSNDGLGTLHELHVPKSMVLMAIAAMSEGSNPSPMVANERAAMGAVIMIAYAEHRYSSGKGAGSFGTIEQLAAEGFISKESFEGHGYKIELTVSATKFTATAIPIEHGKTGRTSYFVDESKVLRGADHGGGVATVNDRPIQ